MSITLNGLAQGYISETIGQRLRAPGVSPGLVNIGEFSAFDDRDWTIAIQDPRDIFNQIKTVKLRNAGLATSSSKGGYIDKNISHIFDPRGLLSAPKFISASVVHSSAMMADGLATAFTLLDEAKIREIAGAMSLPYVLLMRPDEAVVELGLSELKL